MKSTIAAIERWIWVLIYGGLLVLCLGLSVEKSDYPAGWLLVVAGSVIAVLGAILIYVRSRMSPG